MPTLDKLREMFSVKPATSAEPSPAKPLKAWMQEGILCWSKTALKAWCGGSKPRFTPYSDGRPIDVEAFINTGLPTLATDDLQINFGKFSGKLVRPSGTARSGLATDRGYLRFLYNELVRPDEELDHPIGLLIQDVLHETPDTIRGKITAGDVG